MKHALERHRAGEARVIPVILRPVAWEGAPFGHLQMLPKDAKPVTKWPERDEAFLNIAEGIRSTVLELLALRSRQGNNLYERIEQRRETKRLQAAGTPVLDANTAATIAIYEKRLEYLESAYSELEQDNQNMSEELSAQKTQYELLNEQLGNIKKQNAAILKEREELLQRVTESAAEREKLRGDYMRLRQEAQEKIDKLMERIKELNQRLGERKTGIFR